jgi:glycosyltransferase involved in cell wall biosynthesis
VQAFWRTARVVRTLAKDRRFDVVHAANPPDVLLLAALPLKWHGTRFVFDHHDVVPELYLSRFRRRRDLVYVALLVLERVSFRLADAVIATNESYRRIAIGRGKKRPEDVFVVRNGPDLGRFVPQEPDEELRRGRAHLIAYVGMMGPQDGLDHALRALAALQRTRQDWQAVFVGDGDVLPDMRDLATHLGLADLVDFTGLLTQTEVARVLSSADVCIAPEPSSASNDVSTMIKVGEYMAMAKPIACYDLPETRYTADGAALYARPNDVDDLAARLDQLLTDPELRARLGRVGRDRAEKVLAWEHSEPELLAAYAHVLQTGGRARVWKLLGSRSRRA